LVRQVQIDIGEFGELPVNGRLDSLQNRSTGGIHPQVNARRTGR
jgi:hypothetical protein